LFGVLEFLEVELLLGLFEGWGFGGTETDDSYLLDG